MSELDTRQLPLLFGAIADDITGASDLANTLVRGGMSAVLAIGAPGPSDANCIDVEAVVVALKTRTVPAADAVQQSLTAYHWLAARRATVMVKYCSTFDSTEQGNIGPIVDAIREASGLAISVVCPAFPANGRTVYRGRLFVGAVPLDESSMRDHPLTPMRDSSLVRLMSRQTTSRVATIPWETVIQGPAAVASALDDLAHKGVQHVVVDALTDEDLSIIAQGAWGRALLTGGSGIAVGVPAICDRSDEKNNVNRFPPVRGPSVVLAGSCSAATNAQVSAFQAAGGLSYQIDPLKVAADPGAVNAASEWVRQNLSQRPVLIYSTEKPEVLREVQARIGTDNAAALIENALSTVAVSAVGAGATRIVVAGGETSGAVMNALGIRLLRIGPEIAPGVPWTATLGEHPIALALKSGNFGGADFFTRAFEVLHDG